MMKKQKQIDELRDEIARLREQVEQLEARQWWGPLWLWWPYPYIPYPPYQPSPFVFPYDRSGIINPPYRYEDTSGTQIVGTTSIASYEWVVPDNGTLVSGVSDG